jgi:DNA helicase-2/ATP-dependent DNA helicase PcrA
MKLPRLPTPGSCHSLSTQTKTSQEMRPNMSFLATSGNGAQHLASQTARDPAPIIANPGQHPTITPLERAVDLIQNQGATPESLLVVTATDNAAREFASRMRNRLNSNGIKLNQNSIYAGTLHALCLRLLDENRPLTRMKRNYTVMDQFDQHYFIYQRLKDYRALTDSELVMGKDVSRWNQAQNLLKRLNAVAEQALDAKDLAAARHPEARALAACYKLYLQQLTKANALDHSTIQLETLRLLENNPQLLTALKTQWTYLIIDDDKDTSTIEERILACLVNNHPDQYGAGNAEDLYGLRSAADGDFFKFPAQQLGRPTQTETIPWWLM